MKTLTLRLHNLPKALILFKYVYFSVVLLTINLSCDLAQVKTEDFIGEWVTTGFEADAPKLSAAIIEMGKQECLSSKFKLYEDGTFYMESGYFIEGLKGQWKFDSESKQLSFITQEEGLAGYVIEEVDASTSIWIQTSEFGVITAEMSREKW